MSDVFHIENSIFDVKNSKSIICYKLSKLLKPHLNTVR